jgi:hypothetical protein
LSAAAAMKRRAPRWAKDIANDVTRAYGVVTADHRPPPDFLIIGTKRGGTTSLWNYLLDHPNVLPMFPGLRELKSPAYFFEHLDRGEKWYRSHFPTGAWRRLFEHRLKGPVVTGEASPYYLYYPYAPQLVRDAIPTVKLVVLLRDPVRRAYSHYWERVTQGVEPLGFAEALAAESDRLSREVERMIADPGYYSRSHDYFSYRDRGIYRPQLERWLSRFPREQMLLLWSEDLYRDEHSTVETVCDFLGIPRRPVPTRVRHNYIPVPPMEPDVRAELTEFYRPHNESLARLLGTTPPW